MNGCVVCRLLSSSRPGAFITYGHSICYDHVRNVVFTRGDVQQAAENAKIEENDW